LTGLQSQLTSLCYWTWMLICIIYCIRLSWRMGSSILLLLLIIILKLWIIFIDVIDVMNKRRLSTSSIVHGRRPSFSSKLSQTTRDN